MCFKEEGVYAVKKGIFLPWYNAYKFLLQGINRWELTTNKSFIFDEKLSINTEVLTNPTDRWIIVKLVIKLH